MPTVKASDPAFYRLLFEHSMDGVLLTAPDGRVLAANPAACELLQGTEAQLCRLGRSGLVDASDERLAALLEERARTGRARGEINFLRPDGSRFPCEITSALFQDEDGNPLSVLIMRDVTARRRAEQEREKYFRFFTLSQDPLCIADPFGCFLHVNPAFVRLTGYAESELLARPFIEFIVPEDREKTLQEMKLQVSLRPSMQFENRYRRKDGAAILLSWTAYFDRSEGVTYAVAHDITEQRRLQLRERRMEELILCIRRINEHLLVAEDEEELYRFVCDSMHRLTGILGVWLGRKCADGSIDPVAAAGVSLERLRSLGFRWDDSPSGRRPCGISIREGRSVVSEDTALDARFEGMHPALKAERIRTVLAAPITIDAEVQAVLAIWSATAGTFDEEATQFVREVAGDIGVGVRSIQLNQRLTATLKSLQEALDGTVEAIAALVESRDPYTAGHEERVAHLAHAIGAELGFPEKRQEGLRVMGYLHDIGKIQLPAEILSKPGKLSAIEFAMVKEHSEAGYRILKDLDFPWPVAQVVREHHERLDGSGYPQGLRGTQILVEARILAVADTVEAMASHRPYRPALGLEPALAEIRDQRGIRYDPEVVDACLKLFSEKHYQLNQVSRHAA